MAIKQMDNVLIVVEDLETVKAFFAELGMQLEGETRVEGEWADRVVGLKNVQNDIAMMRTPDGHGRIELSKFIAPKATRDGSEEPAVNTLGFAASCSPSTTSTKSSTASAPMEPNSWAKSPSTKTCTASASCAAPKASSSD